MYEYDQGGRLVRSLTTTEAEWDEQERAWALALAAYEDALCPLCGRPLSICTDPATEGKWTAPPPTRCFASTAISRAREPYSGKNTKNPDALMFTAMLT